MLPKTNPKFPVSQNRQSYLLNSWPSQTGKGMGEVTHLILDIHSLRLTEETLLSKYRSLHGLTWPVVNGDAAFGRGMSLLLTTPIGQSHMTPCNPKWARNTIPACAQTVEGWNYLLKDINNTSVIHSYQWNLNANSFLLFWWAVFLCGYPFHVNNQRNSK